MHAAAMQGADRSTVYSSFSLNWRREVFEPNGIDPAILLDAGAAQRLPRGLARHEDSLAGRAAASGLFGALLTFPWVG
jgi:hypothetical protein